MSRSHEEQSIRETTWRYSYFQTPLDLKHNLKNALLSISVDLVAISRYFAKLALFSRNNLLLYYLTICEGIFKPLIIIDVDVQYILYYVKHYIKI